MALVVSPHLQTLAPELDEGAWGSVRADPFPADEPHALLLDWLEQRTLVVPRRVHEALVRARREQRPVAEQLGGALCAGLEALGVLQSDAVAFRRHRVMVASVETTAHCNIRCTFCPQADNPKPKATMAPQLFGVVLDRLAEYGVEVVSCSNYSEPTNDPNLGRYARMIAERGMRLAVYTNATLIDRVIDELDAIRGSLMPIVVNLPAFDRATYQRLTASPQYDRVIRNVRTLLERQFKVVFCYNNTDGGRPAEQVQQEVEAQLEALFGASLLAMSKPQSRAGALSGRAYVQAVQHRGRLGGCLQLLQQVDVRVDGRVGLCCNDYDNKLMFESVADRPLAEILGGDAFERIRRKVYGDEAPEPDFICSACTYTSAAADLTSLCAGGGLQEFKWVTEPHLFRRTLETVRFREGEPAGRPRA